MPSIFGDAHPITLLWSGQWRNDALSGPGSVVRLATPSRRTIGISQPSSHEAVGPCICHQ